MSLHRNPRVSPKGRLLLCERVLGQGWSLAAAAEAAGVSERTAGKWVGRFGRDGEAGLADRSSAPARVANKTSEQTIEAIAALRRVRFTRARIAELLEMAPLDGVRHPQADRAGQAVAAGPGRAA